MKEVLSGVVVDQPVLKVATAEAAHSGHIEVVAYAGSAVVGQTANGANGSNSKEMNPAAARLHRLTHDPVGQYLEDIGKTPLLTGEQELELAGAIELGWYAEDLLSLRNPETREATQTSLMKGLLVRAKMLAESRQEKRAQANKPVVGPKTPVDAVAAAKPGKSRNLPFEPLTETEEGRRETIEALTLRAEWLPDEIIPELEKAVVEGEQARNLFIRANLRLAASMAKRLQYRGLSYMELIQAANTGVVRSVDKYNRATQLKFSTYAPWWIRQALMNAINTTARPVRYPADVEARMSKVRMGRSKAQTSLGHEPSSQEIADFLNEQQNANDSGSGKPHARKKLFTPEEVEKLSDLDREPLYLDEPIDDQAEHETMYRKLAKDQQAVGYELESDERRAAIDACLQQLSKNEQTVTRMFFGLPPYENTHTRAEIAKALDLGVKAVRSCVDRARKKLAKMPELEALAE